MLNVSKCIILQMYHKQRDKLVYSMIGKLHWNFYCHKKTKHELYNNHWEQNIIWLPKNSGMKITHCKFISIFWEVVSCFTELILHIRSLDIRPIFWNYKWTCHSNSAFSFKIFTCVITLKLYLELKFLFWSKYIS